MKPVIQLSVLGKLGRFGNQLFQYAHGKLCAEAADAELLVPEDWIGRKLFHNVNEGVCGPQLARSWNQPGDVNCEMWGHFQDRQTLAMFSRARLRSMFLFRNEWLEAFPKLHPSYVAAHIRHGDYLSVYPHYWCSVTKASYEKAMKPFHPMPVEWVSEETPRKADVPHDLSFLPDFMALLRADVLFRGNSTFSWWAGVLGNALVFSPVVGEKRGLQDCEFASGNEEKIFFGGDRLAIKP